MNINLANRKRKDQWNFLLAGIADSLTPTDLKVTAIWWREYELLGNRVLGAELLSSRRTVPYLYFRKDFRWLRNFLSPGHSSALGCIVASSPKGRPLQKPQGVREIFLVLQPHLQLIFLCPLSSAGIICLLLRCLRAVSLSWAGTAVLGIARAPSLPSSRHAGVSHSFINSANPPNKNMVWDAGVTPSLAELPSSEGEMKFTKRFRVTPAARGSTELKMCYFAVTS